MERDGQIVGVGIDAVETLRMQTVLDRWGARFKDRVFLPAEQRYCETKAVPARHYAGRFAVKEAVSKALGTGITPSLNWLDMEVVRDAATGAPSVRLSRRAAALARTRGVARILVSLSHTEQMAVANAVATAAAGESEAP